MQRTRRKIPKRLRIKRTRHKAAERLGNETTRLEKLQLFRAMAYFQEHPAILGTLLYIQVSIVGIIYDWALFRKFNINMADFAEANDFFLAAFKEPLVLLQTFATIIIAFIPWYCFKVLKQLPTGSVDHGTMKVFRLSYQLLVPTLIFYTIVPPFFFAEINSKKIITGENGRVIVELRIDSAKMTQLKSNSEFYLIGTTEKFMFFYNKKEGKSHIVPIANIASVKLLKPRKPTSTDPP